MQKVTFLKDYLNYKKGETYNVTSRHADILFRTKLAEKEKVNLRKEEKAPSKTKEEKAEKKSK